MTRTRTTSLALALTLACAAAPAALAGGHGVAPADRSHAAERPSAAPKPPAPRTYLLRGVVAADAAETSVEVDVKGGNRALRRALAGARTLAVELGETTRIRLVGRGRAADVAGGPRKPRMGTYADLGAGDRVRIVWRAPRATAAEDLGAPRIVVDHGPARGRRPARA